MKVGLGVDEFLNFFPQSRLASDDPECACGDDILHFCLAGAIGPNPDFLADVEAGAEDQAAECGEDEKKESHGAGGS